MEFIREKQGANSSQFLDAFPIYLFIIPIIASTRYCPRGRRGDRSLTLHKISINYLHKGNKFTLARQVAIGMIGQFLERNPLFSADSFWNTAAASRMLYFITGIFRAVLTYKQCTYIQCACLSSNGIR